MHTDPGMESRLWDYIDGLSSPEEKRLIDQLIRSEKTWQLKYNELNELHDLVNAVELEQPSMRFTRNVMDEIAKLQISPAASSYINKNVIRGLAIFFITMIFGFVIYSFGQMEWNFNSDSVLPVEISSFDYTKIFNNTLVNIFMMINVILGLFLLDRYLASKRKDFQH